MEQHEGIYWKTHQRNTFALLQTTSGLLRMAEYCLEKKGFNYFLCGKVQTDKLEERFGKYRQQAGSNYNVFIRQVFESESKIRMQNTMPLILHSQCSGEIHIGINEIQVNDEPDSSAEIGISPFLRDVAHVSDDDLIVSDETWPILVYVSGYAAYSATKKFRCEYCNRYLCNKLGKVIFFRTRCGINSYSALSRKIFTFPNSN
jgi:hypothetical protein